uniref:Uncharacterized protein n=1 Tax=Anguilla anguilla TaxID=7936 RepID=A0A0E9T3X4_ANGAN
MQTPHRKAQARFKTRTFLL